MKKIFKILGIILLVIIPIILIIMNMFFDFFGYIVFVNEKNQTIIDEIMKTEGIDIFQSKFIIVNSQTGDDDVKIITEEFGIKNIKLDSENLLIKYAEKYGIDIYYTITKMNYIYVIGIAIIIFLKKLLENADMFGKMEERDN